MVRCSTPSFDTAPQDIAEVMNAPGYLSGKVGSVFTASGMLVLRVHVLEHFCSGSRKGCVFMHRVAIILRCMPHPHPKGLRPASIATGVASQANPPPPPPPNIAIALHRKE